MEQRFVDNLLIGGGVNRFHEFKSSIFLLIVSIWALLSLSGCGRKTDTALRFEMEKMMLGADRLSRELSIKGASLSEEDLNTLVEAYHAITLKVSPARDSLEVSVASDAKKEAWALASLANTRIGILYLDLRLYDEAIYHFDAVINHLATSDLQKNAVLNYMARTNEKAMRFIEAAAFYDSLANGYRRVAVPDSPNLDALGAPIRAAEMWLTAGNSREFGKRLEKARDYYNDLIQEYPDSPLGSAATGKLAASYLREHKYAEAIEVLESTRDQNTGFISPNILMRIADIYMNNLKDFPKAEQTYRAFISSHPDNKQLGPAYLGLGLSLFKQRRFAESRRAVSDIEKLPLVSQEAVLEANYLIALCYDNEDRWELSKGQLDYIQGSFPGTDKAFEAALYTANRYRSTGQTELARKAFDDAEKYISRYVDQTGANTVSVSRAMGYLVRCYIEQEDYEKGSRILLQLYQNFPQLPEGRFAPLKLADLYENALHDTARAVSWLRTFVDNNPENADLENVKAHIRRLETATDK
jgi:tetratricopeptide (TPR) repeat protein